MTVRTVLVTGGTRGLGLATAQACAEAGHRVAITGRDRAALAAATARTPGLLALEADVTDAARAPAVLAEVEAAFGPVEVLVNNAGFAGPGPQPLWELEPEVWWRVLETNVKGPMLYCHAAVPSMRAAGWGVIVNVGSYIGIRPEAGATAYGTSKAALARLTDCLAEELMDAGVQVFCVSPGLVRTDMTRVLPFLDELPPEAFNAPGDLARVVLALAGGAYGALTGAFLHVNDDLDVLRAEAAVLRERRLHRLCLHGLEGLIP